MAKWGQKYSLAVNPWKNHWPHVATFFKYPEHIRKIIYTTNASGGSSPAAPQGNEKPVGFSE
jgi:transposase-like protein